MVMNKIYESTLEKKEYYENYIFEQTLLEKMNERMQIQNKLAGEMFFLEAKQRTSNIGIVALSNFKSEFDQA
jgi:hypothetical protein